MTLVIYADGVFFHYKKRNVSFWNQGTVSVWPAQSSFALLSLARWSGSELVFWLKQLESIQNANTGCKHNTRVPHYSLTDLRLTMDYILMHTPFYLLIMGSAEAMQSDWKWSDVKLIFIFNMNHSLWEVIGLLVIFIMHSKFISLCHYTKPEWIKRTKATFALESFDAFTVLVQLNKTSWTRCCFGKLAKVSVDRKITNGMSLVEKTDVQRRSKKD